MPSLLFLFVLSIGDTDINEYGYADPDIDEYPNYDSYINSLPTYWPVNERKGPDILGVHAGVERRKTTEVVPMKRDVWPSNFVYYLSITTSAALAFATTWLLTLHQPIIARGIVGGIVIASLWGFHSSQRIVKPTGPSFQFPQDLRHTFRNMLISYFWLTILGLSALLVYYALVYLSRSFVLLLR